MLILVPYFLARATAYAISVALDDAVVVGSWSAVCSRLQLLLVEKWERRPRSFHPSVVAEGNGCW